MQDKAIRRVNNNNNRVIILNKPNQGHTTLAQRSELPIELEAALQAGQRIGRSQKLRQQSSYSVMKLMKVGRSKPSMVKMQSTLFSWPQ